jgi:hypothetical protein
MDPLELPLRDIHLPEPVPFWPLAPGWWILLGILVAVVVTGWLLYQRKKYLQLSAIRQARTELEKIVSHYESNKNPLELGRQLSILLRRISISLFPRTEVASLTGDQWLEFLDKQTSGEPFSKHAGRILAEAPYRNELSVEDVELLLQHCRAWIDSVAVAKGKTA